MKRGDRMSDVPVTSAGLTEEQAIQAGTMLRQAWDVLRSLQGNKTASVLRYTVTQTGKPHLGIEEQKALVPGLADLDVFVSRLSTREVLASNGVLELTDLLFIFYQEVKATDKVLHGGVTYEVVQIRAWEVYTGQCQIIGRAV